MERLRILFILALFYLATVNADRGICGEALDLKPCPMDTDYYMQCANSNYGSMQQIMIFERQVPRSKVLLQTPLGWSRFLSMNNCSRLEESVFVPLIVKRKNEIGSMDFSIHIDGRKLLINSDPPSQQCIFVASKETWSTISNVTNPDVILPESVLLKTGTLTVKMFCGDVSSVRTLLITGIWNCPASDCIFCKNSWNNLRCQPRWIQFLVASMIIFVLMMIGIISFLIYKLVRCAISRRSMKQYNSLNLMMDGSNDIDPQVRFEKKDLESKKKNPKPSVRMSEEQLNLEEESVDVERSVEMLPLTTSRATAKFSLSKGIFLCMVVISLSCHMANACTSAPTLVSKNVMCYEASGDKRVCELKSTISGSIIGLDNQLCFTITDSSQNFSSDVRIRLIDFRRTLLLSKAYWTSDATIVAVSKKRCSGAGYCTGDKCRKSNWTVNICANGELSGPACSLPGFTRCSASCGCAGCGCGLCTDGCLWYRVSLQPFGPRYVVYDILGFEESVELQYETTMDEPKSLGRFTIGGSISTEFLNGTITSTGASTQSLFGSRKVVNGNGKTWILDASPLNGMIASAIGDIQSDLESGLSSPRVGSFNYPWNAISVSELQSSISVFLPRMGIKNLESTTFLLPKVMGDSYWNFNGETVSGSLVSVPAISFSLASSLNVTQLVTHACPSVQYVNVTGCRSCNSGVSIAILAKSTCVSGQVEVSSSSDVMILTKSVALSTSERFIYIQARTTRQNNNVKLKFCSSISCKELTIDFTVYYESTVNPIDEDQTNTPNGKKGGIDLNWSLKIPKWAFGLIMGIVGVLLIGVASYLIFRFIMSRKVKGSPSEAEVMINDSPNDLDQEPLS